MLRTTGKGRGGMVRFGAWWVVALLCLGWFPALHATTLDPAVLPRVKAATFEVVAAKPTHDPLSYEKPLPMDLLPYQQRTDKYYSIGTAFAIGHGRYVTAGHVLMTGRGSLWGPPELRDSAGHVYAIDKILKFSLEKDFVVFTLKQDPGKAALEIDKHPQLNQTVYAVGNALGTGIVIRDGLYTSRTPEKQDGRWKWMRFSAAASPGNSGGPLLDSHGNVIGVVLMKSPNENLNYALPMSEVLNAPDDVAEADKRIGYGFDVFDESLNNAFKARFALPKSLPAFFAAFQKHMHAFTDAQLKAVLAKNPSAMFPHGKGSEKLLHGTATMSDFPSMIVRDSSGVWRLSGHRFHKFDLDDNGEVSVGLFKHELLFHLSKPDSVSAAKLYSHPRTLMDLFLKTGMLHRKIGNEKIDITSMGKPSLATTHVDKWHRRWQIFEWSVPYNNHEIYMAALPVPDGYVGMLDTSTANNAHDYLINLKAITDFFYVAYDGTLAQWKEFLKQPRILPADFSHIKIDIDYGHRFRYASRRVKLDVTPELQKVQPDSDLTLGFGFSKNHGKTTLGVANVRLAAQRNDHDIIRIRRHKAPSAHLDRSVKNMWDKVLHRRHPYDAVAHSDDDATRITGVVGASAEAKPTVIYTADFGLEGSPSQTQMKDKLDLLLKNLKVTDPAVASTHP